MKVLLHVHVSLLCVLLVCYAEFVNARISWKLLYAEDATTWYLYGVSLQSIYFIFDFLNIHSLCLHTSPRICSSSAQKYFRRATRLNWPEGAVSRESIRAVRKLDRLKVSVSLKFALSQLIITFYLETLIHSCYWSGYLFFLDFKGNWVWLRLEVRVCTYSY